MRAAPGKGRGRWRLPNFFLSLLLIFHSRTLVTWPLPVIQKGTLGGEEWINSPGTDGEKYPWTVFSPGVGGLRRVMAKSPDRRQRLRRQRNSETERNGQRPQRGGEKSDRGTRDLDRGQRHNKEGAREMGDGDPERGRQRSRGGE